MNDKSTETLHAKVLIVEDSIDDLTLLSTILADTNYEIRTAITGKKALQSVTTVLPDIILLDLGLPDMNGIEVCRQIKIAPESNNVPIIVVSASGGTGSKLKAFNSGAIDFITKPYEATEILARINTHLNLSKLQNKIKLSEAKYRALYENAPLAYQSLTENGYLLDVNPCWLKTLGYSREEVIGKHYTDFLHPDGKSDFDKTFPLLKKLGFVDDKEYLVRHKNGNYLHINLNACIGYNSDGSFRQTYGVFQDRTKRRETEEELRKQKEMFELVLDSVPIRIFWKDTNSIYLGCNPAFAEAAGLSNTNEVIGKRDSDLLWAKEAEKFINDDRQVLNSGCPKMGYEESYSTPEGKPVWWRSSKMPLKNNDGEILGVLATSVDITESKKVQKLLRQSEAKFRSLYENSPFGMAICKMLRGKSNEFVDFIHIELNESVHTNTGFERDQLEGKKASELVDSEILKELVDTYGQVIYTGEPTKYVQYFDLYDRTLDITAFKLHGDYFIINFYDISERKQFENALLESEKRYKLLVENQTDLIVKVDLDGRFLYVSPSYCQFFGKSEDELLNSKFMPMVHEEDRERTELAMQHLYKPPYFCFIEQRAKTIDGWKWLRWSDTAVLNENNEVIEIIGLGQDITEQKEAEAEQKKLKSQLRQSQKMEAVGRLAGGVAHDFNNMLGVILGHSELVMEQMTPDQPNYDNLSAIFEAGKRSADLTKQLLAFARKQTITPRVIDLNQTLSGMNKMLQRIIGEDINLSWSPGKDLWNVRVDPSQIDQILVNLCINARDAIEDIGSMTIETKNATLDETFCSIHVDAVPGEYVQLLVCDNGCGMNSETIENIFEPFFTTKDPSKGTGLGLATVYGIVRQNDGFICVYSEKELGTTFTIYFPRHLAQVPRQTEEDNRPSPNKNYETILLVEDEPAILTITTMILESEGYIVLQADTPGKAIELAHTHNSPIHLLMTDIVMPEMNGRILARNILGHFPDLKRLFMSGYTADIIAHHGVLDEGVNFIQKPFSKKDLSRVVREVLDQD